MLDMVEDEDKRSQKREFNAVSRKITKAAEDLGDLIDHGRSD